MTRFVAVLLTCALIGCRAHPPRPPAPAAPVAPPAIALPHQPAVIGARWSFAIVGNTCVARATSADLSLLIRVGSDQKVEFSLAGPALRLASARRGMRAQLRFAGTTGSWALQARSDSHRTFMVVLNLNATAAHDVFAALGGGTLHAQPGRVPVLRIPDSEVAGLDWFECVRDKLGHTTPTG
jgi:hypothetical protein